jgi:hypothetical protein
VKHKKIEDAHGDAPGHNLTPGAAPAPGGATRQRAATPAASIHDRAHPHDRIFKEIFAVPEAQQDLVTMALPPAITSRFRLETIRDAGQESGSGRADLVLTVETTDDTTELVYVLVEHKSRPAPLVAVQLMGYVAEVMKRRKNPPVPVVYPRTHGRAAISTEWIRDQASRFLPWPGEMDRADGAHRASPAGGRPHCLPDQPPVPPP